MEENLRMTTKFKLDNDPEATYLRKEAKRLLNDMFKVPEGSSDNTIDRIIDCIIEATLLEVRSGFVTKNSTC